MQGYHCWSATNNGESATKQWRATNNGEDQQWIER